ncbi:SDR family NAD(P)-dependent oxidoreductase [Burkholderia multivorans]|uniref:SDR family NAD(P)-dependent oxidoreductase n=1 Tax=Burkholderia multivorans TaxID=87883 RepID=UPI0021C1D051|nr:SDR family oxidoreductase [Burkholderia multivorans]
MNIDLDGKVAFVTGGSRGIGRSIADVLVDSGAKVAIMARGQRDLDTAIAELEARHPGRSLGVQGDVSSQEQLISAVRRTVAHFGGLHLAVNNAGIAGKPGLLHVTGAENWRQVMGVNLDGVAWAMIAEIEEMMKAGGGSIVNIASVEAHTILKQFPAYVASKHALIGLTKATAADYAGLGIRINSVSPGVIRTPLTMAQGQKEVTDRLAGRIPLGRLGEPQEIARAVVFLLSDLSSYTTGTDLVVDGAFLLRE